ncbi:MAG: exo-alpha-sialidase [Novipirellula sp. JB048]
MPIVLGTILGLGFSPLSAQATLSTQTTSFDNATSGTFETLATPAGQWSAPSGGAAIVNRYGVDNSKCLHLSGPHTVVELKFDGPTNQQSELSFQSERWTSQGPFEFRIEQRVASEWVEVYNGDRSTRLGRTLLTDVRVPLAAAGENRLRFRVNSPAGKGVLIDELRIAPARPQTVRGVEVVPVTLPALVGARSSALLKLNIKASGTLEPISLTSVSGALTPATSLPEVSSLQLHFTGSRAHFTRDSMLAAPVAAADSFSLAAEQPLVDGDNFFWIACTLSDAADLDGMVGAVCTSLSFSDGSTLEVDPVTSNQRTGIALRSGGDDGVHTYRIPGLATTTQGTLIAVYDVRYRGGGDLPGDIDVGMSRSTDGGRTWQPMQIIMDMGDDPAFRYDGVGDPSVLVDPQTGTIWCAALWSHGNRGWHGSGPGLTPAETGQFVLVRSDDDGVTWSEPINITEQVKKPEWNLMLAGPGKGIALRDGTLVFPAQYQDPANPQDRRAHRLPHSSIIFSRDSGQTWQSSAGAFDDTTEAQVIELANGELMLNCRYNREGKRVVMTTSDLGATWTEHESSRSALIEPGACMASLIHVDHELRAIGQSPTGDPNLLLFSNPNSTRGRNHMTIKASRDGGVTWPARYELLLDEQPSAGYSCLSMIDDETVGILYEGSQSQLTFQRVKLTEILD